MVETTTCPEVAAVYAQFPWLEKVCPQAGVDHACVRNLKEICALVRNASAYLVQANGDFAEIEQKVVKKPLWSGAVFIGTYKEIDTALAIQQADSAAYIVLIQDRCLTIFEKA